MKWYKFDSKKGYRQKRPEIKKWVLVIVKSQKDGIPNGVRIGYRKDAAGAKNCPQFIIPGGNFTDKQLEVIAWCDGLRDNFAYPAASYQVCLE